MIMQNLIDQLLRMPAPFLMAVLMAFAAFGAGTVMAIAGYIRDYMCHCRDIELKREMLDRGLAIDDIERLLRAGSPTVDAKPSRGFGARFGCGTRG